MRAPQTWHHGLIADWWANFNLDAPEVELYRRYLRSPVLDAGCGAGRFFGPLLAAGYDIDGCDVSADMIDRCRRRAPGATLWVSPLHELVPPAGTARSSPVVSSASAAPACRTRRRFGASTTRSSRAARSSSTTRRVRGIGARATGRTRLRGRRRLTGSSSRCGAASTRSTSVTAASI